jgi:hypothetical protein
MYLSPEAQRALEEIRGAHERLIARFGSGEAHRRAFRAVYEAIESAVAGLSEEQFEAPIDGGWSRAQILVHLREHDQQIEEASREGIEHMIEHGLEHARSLWLARMPARSAGSR